MKIAFDATIDDFVDSHKRMLKRSRMAGKWGWLNIMIAFFFAGTVYYLISPGESGMRMFEALMVASVAAAGLPYICKFGTDGKLKKRLREQLGTKGPIRIEVEISDACFAVNQMGALVTHDWQNILSAEINRNAMEIMHRRGGMTVIRSRAFSSQKEQDEFASLVKYYIKRHGRETGVL